ncbi:MAG: hypothetical protein RLZZ219_1987 [Cyanobacteriota bacterium]
MYGRQLSSLDQEGGTLSGSKNDLGAGVALMIPLGGTGFKTTCSTLLRLQEARARISLANQMLEAGQISEAEMKRIVESLRRTLEL